LKFLEVAYTNETLVSTTIVTEPPNLQITNVQSFNSELPIFAMKIEMEDVKPDMATVDLCADESDKRSVCKVEVSSTENIPMQNVSIAESPNQSQVNSQGADQVNEQTLKDFNNCCQWMGFILNEMTKFPSEMINKKILEISEVLRKS
jgi:hypothetical protein